MTAIAARKPPLNARHRCARTFVSIQLIFATLAFGGMPGMGFAVPPDPQRSFVVTDCDATKERLLEALRGSPLISEAENAETVIIASDWAERLCGADFVKQMGAEFEMNNNAKHD